MHARARTTDPETSHQAAASVRDLRATQREVLDLIRRFGPLTDERLVSLAAIDHVRQSPSGLRSRRSELVALGLVEWTGEYEPLDSGRNARVWGAAHR